MSPFCRKNEAVESERMEVWLARFRPRAPSPECRARIAQALGPESAESGRMVRVGWRDVAAVAAAAAVLALVGAGVILFRGGRRGRMSADRSIAGSTVAGNEASGAIPAIIAGGEGAGEEQSGALEAPPVQVWSRRILGIRPSSGQPMVMYGCVFQPVRVQCVDRRELVWEDKGVRLAETTAGSDIAYLARPLL